MTDRDSARGKQTAAPHSEALRAATRESLLEVRQLTWAVDAIARMIPTADDPLPLVTAIRVCSERIEEELAPLLEHD